MVERYTPMDDGDVALSADFAQGGNALAYSQTYGVAALADGSVVLTGYTTGEMTGTVSNAGGEDFAVIKLSEAGVEEWAWQVTKV